jgi:hypothetical protein
MKREKFSCHACGKRMVQSYQGQASCSECGSEYKVSIAEVAKVAAIAPVSFFASLLTGAWWIWLLVLPAGLYFAFKFDREGKKWRLVHFR